MSARCGAIRPEAWREDLGGGMGRARGDCPRLPESKSLRGRWRLETMGVRVVVCKGWGGVGGEGYVVGGPRWASIDRVSVVGPWSKMRVGSVVEHDQ